VVFAAMGLTHADAAAVRSVLEERSATGDLVLLLNLADEPVIEQLLTPAWPTLGLVFIDAPASTRR
jgi:V/A-type H+/Na+-transporting ATPase subunit B